MILITGATGKLGGIVIDTLLKNNVPANKIAALVRDENKAVALKSKGIDIRIGDYDNKPSLDQAMKGIDKVLLVSGLDIGKVVEQHKNVVGAAKSKVTGQPLLKGALKVTIIGALAAAAAFFAAKLI